MKCYYHPHFSHEELRQKEVKKLTQGQTANKLVYELSSNYKILSVANISGCERNKTAECAGVGGR